MRAERFVKTWYVCQSARIIVRAIAKIYSSGTLLWKRSLMELTKIILLERHFRGSASFSGMRRRSNPNS